MRSEYGIDLLQFDLDLKEVLDIVIYHLQQLDQCLRVFIGAVNCGHFIIHTASLVRNFQRGICAKYMGIAANWAIVPQLVE